MFPKQAIYDDAEPCLLYATAGDAIGTMLIRGGYLMPRWPLLRCILGFFSGGQAIDETSNFWNLSPC